MTDRVPYTRRIAAALLCAALAVGGAACGGTGAAPTADGASDAAADVTADDGTDATAGDGTDDESAREEETHATPPRKEKTRKEETMTAITITVGGAEFAATLETTPAARRFAAMLPLTLHMDELNSNEKYHYLDETLPAEPQSVGSIGAGDLMLYGTQCVVLFYRSFRTPYSYTRLGRVDDPRGLADALGAGPADVAFAAR